jgi:translation initiation factor 2B subunit (eIF-2B alpha/beta/delta family)
MPIILNEYYEKKLNTIKNTIRNLENGSRSPLVPYTPHGIDTHIIKLERHLDDIFPEEEMRHVNKLFSEKDKFLFLAGIWLHDVGMYSPLLPDDPDESITSNAELKKWDEEVRRKMHHERSESYVLQNYRNLGLEDKEARDIALICLSHRKSRKIPEYTEENICLIIAYLRLLDALHIPERPSRDEIGTLRDYLAYGMEPVSKFHWYKSFYVSEIRPSPEDLKLTIKFALPREWINNTKKMDPLIRSIERDILDEIDAVKDILIKAKIKHQLPAYIYIDHDFKLTPFMPEEVASLDSLLAIIRLFDPTMSPNSGEIIKIVLEGIGMCVEGVDYTSCAKTFDAYMRGVFKPLLSDRSCHIYLWNLFEELEKYRIELNRKRETRNPNDLMEDIRAVRDLIKALKWWREELPEMFNIESKICRGDSLLLYGFSRAVITTLNALDDETKSSIQVFVCECNTKTKHRYNNRILYYDGVKYIEELKQIGINDIKLIPDLCASNIFLRFHETRERGCIKVIFGANGITNKYVFHTLGHLGITEMARAPGIEIPIYVVAEGMKIRSELERSLDKQREGPWHPTDIAIIDNFKEVDIYNPKEDVVPIDKITAVITELGIYNTNEPWSQLLRIAPNIDYILREYKAKRINV